MAWYKCKKSSEITIPPWATGSDAELKAVVDAYYAGDLSLADIQAVWNIGDEREVTLSAMDDASYGTPFAAQTVKFVIMNWGGKTLTDNTECLAIVGQKNSLAEGGYMNRTDTNRGGWVSCSKRTWCNYYYKNAIPSGFRELFKEHYNQSGEGGGSRFGTETTSDYFALPAEIEVFGTTTYSVTGEGSQFKYYETSANRRKRKGEGGSYYYWWERSPYQGTSAYFCCVYGNGNAGYDYASSSSNGLAPFGCI